MKDLLGNRMKNNFENRTRYFLPRRTYTLIRVDGKSFHTFTKGMDRPYDQNFTDIMDETAKFLCEEIQGCKLAYVQSDEISLLLTDFEKDSTDAWFDGNIQKIVSVSASMATAKFNELYSSWQTGVSAQKPKLAFFDSRTYTIPDPTEVENYFVWRNKDCMRNAIQMTAQTLYSHKELNGRTQTEQRIMIFDKDFDYDNLYLGFRLGRFIFKRDTGEWKKTSFDILKERIFFGNLIPKYK